MDRQNKGKTITIKINGTNQTYQETKAKEKEIEVDRFEANNDRYISTNETAATKEVGDDENFDWILPDDSTDEEIEIEEYKIAKPSKKKETKTFGALSVNFKRKNRNGMLTSVFITVFFAILLGTSFGLLLLKLVTTENPVENELPVVADPVVEEPVNQTDGEETLTLEALSTFIVQGGVFSTKESAEGMKETTIQLGAPAQVIESNGQFILYLSVADRIEYAKEIGEKLKSQGLEVFAKPISFDSKSLDGLQPEEKKVMESIQKLYQSLTTAVSEAQVAMSISAPTFENIEKNSAELSGIENSKLQIEEIIQLKAEVDQAIQQVNALKQSPDQATAMKLQQRLLSFLAIYQSL
ncbi:stage II sporulation protein B [Cytobacillus eiseniae]|uniref:Stage II sporulation protein B n=1 Tax=Cytobacillus eiseniae TaxID=762947 RepID=A0ABS4RCG5_9BACI|nr:hypothetical protein [Cytobacillus eiseniae]MBP2240586.1 stage II sporulation protein B [Cytobacillus eiseniae]